MTCRKLIRHGIIQLLGYVIYPNKDAIIAWISSTLIQRVKIAVTTPAIGITPFCYLNSYQLPTRKFYHKLNILVKYKTTYLAWNMEFN